MAVVVPVNGPTTWCEVLPAGEDVESRDVVPAAPSTIATPNKKSIERTTVSAEKRMALIFSWKDVANVAAAADKARLPSAASVGPF